MQVTKRLPQQRLIGVAPAARELGVHSYGVLVAIIRGELDCELVDGEPKVTLESVERRKRAR
jgi:hypothetical protein